MKFFSAENALYARLLRWFPEREFFMRAEGQVKFLKISSRLQITVFLAIFGAILLWLLTTLGMAFSQVSVSLDRMALNERQAVVADSESRVEAYRDSVDKVAADLQRRQDELDALAERYFPAKNSKMPAQAGEDAQSEEAIAEKISALVPEARALAFVEARQLAFVAMLSAEADRRSAEAESAIRKLGLNPQEIARDNGSAQGGPFLPFTDAEDDETRLDPRFITLGQKLARMDALERGLAHIPSAEPADMNFISSGFGYRRDPFTRRGAMHNGLDFKGPYGQPIVAAASGTVSFAGWKGGYGRTVEIDHGNGLVTRYAHLSGINVAVGNAIDEGSKIGAMGSSGRSTGTHLHFEVRMNGKAINPKPFLEANSDVLKIQANAQQRTRADGGDV
ncbi:M23 family metallopeptidase [Alterisphingorhabdus coralli]|uniref:M23 family metallopeptidase n=1 Tax=Alterisphingorhabdus coralli TaxID=3071408 RepID=A0AA97HZS2_9SPHN|nr:M23 family metallopeptidase [Parasphingorhabdus sp. SCSIO 66989]WOE75034.1 M23 family metallopeptidase [Parasphingorhabdus sp. SCSIO 66989]